MTPDELRKYDSIKSVVTQLLKAGSELWRKIQKREDGGSKWAETTEFTVALRLFRSEFIVSRVRGMKMLSQLIDAAERSAIAAQPGWGSGWSYNYSHNYNRTSESCAV